MHAAARLGLRTLSRAAPRAAAPRRPMAAAAAAAAPGPATFHMLRYAYVPDILERRDPFRPAHLAAARAACAAGTCVLAGALTEPVDGAVFIFRGVSAEAVAAFVAADPYVQAGLVASHEIRPYAVVAGDAALKIE
jgi:uncharacterized protein YciI